MLHAAIIVALLSKCLISQFKCMLVGCPESVENMTKIALLLLKIGHIYILLHMLLILVTHQMSDIIIIIFFFRNSSA